MAHGPPRGFHFLAFMPRQNEPTRNYRGMTHQNVRFGKERTALHLIQTEAQPKLSKSSRSTQKGAAGRIFFTLTVILQRNALTELLQSHGGTAEALRDASLEQGP